MPLDFVPLFPNTASTQPACAPTALRGSARQDAGFAALFPDARVATPPPVHATPLPAHARECLPVVTLKRDGERVTRIQVRCSCGEVVELDCVY